MSAEVKLFSVTVNQLWSPSGQFVVRGRLRAMLLLISSLRDRSRIKMMQTTYTLKDINLIILKLYFSSKISFVEVIIKLINETYKISFYKAYFSWHYKIIFSIQSVVAIGPVYVNWIQVTVVTTTNWQYYIETSSKQLDQAIIGMNHKKYSFEAFKYSTRQNCIFTL